MKPQHKPLYLYRIPSILSVFLLVSAFVLLLLVGLSLTIIKPIYLIRVFDVDFTGPPTSLATELRFGVWGVCASGRLNEPTAFENNGLCIGPTLGYSVDLPTDFLEHFGLSQTVVSAALNSLLTVLVLHLVAAGFSLAGLIPALFLASHSLTILSLVLTTATALLTTVVFIIDLVIVLTVKTQVPKVTNNGISAEIGNGTWMVLGAMIASWLAVIVLSARACYCCGVRRKCIPPESGRLETEKVQTGNA